VKAVRGDDANIMAIWRGVEKSQTEDGPLGKLAKVREYRNTFAEILVIGAILQRLEGEEKNKFERWRTRDEDEEEETEQDQAKDLEKVADEQFDGMTKKIMRYHAQKMRRVRERKGHKGEKK
jgi:potassium channel subfamily K